jgi:hypothetical protein
MAPSKTYRAYNASENSEYSNEARATTLPQGQDGAIIVDHTCTHLALIPEQWIVNPKNSLHIAYGHSSHGSQLVDGMTGLAGRGISTPSTAVARTAPLTCEIPPSPGHTTWATPTGPPGRSRPGPAIKR